MKGMWKPVKRNDYYIISNGIENVLRAEISRSGSAYLVTAQFGTEDVAQHYADLMNKKDEEENERAS
jgi:hypothetical protein